MSAPSFDRKHPDIFWCIFVMRRSFSPWLLVKGTIGLVMKRNTSCSKAGGVRVDSGLYCAWFAHAVWGFSFHPVAGIRFRPDWVNSGSVLYNVLLVSQAANRLVAWRQREYLWTVLVCVLPTVLIVLLIGAFKFVQMVCVAQCVFAVSVLI